ncbi:GNAT family N-acetyltransferase [Clostridium saccharobutylicum]|uniref:N-acetyltransferase domain-containing protein n=1 Tax=Clostridium saccharobutylicum TaxID=169679 RepID=A0A1S8MYQ1_CLOSA|nr:GNAT family N-acetyltransferase [Clostridium saccharobutylicum]OOM09317.1 hypothetical protein CLOSAC_35980 [Clostridium saccharobutylicum]
MKLIENHDAILTETHLNNFIKFKESYGLTDEVISYISYSISKGEKLLRCPESSQKLFEIHEGKECVGEIIITTYEEDPPELDVLIFDEFQGKGYAEKALRKFLDDYCTNYTNIEATIRHKNLKRTCVKHLLEKLGFKFCYNSNDVAVYSKELCNIHKHN